MRRSSVSCSVWPGIAARISSTVSTTPSLAASRPLPLALFGAPCRFRHAASEALDAAGIPWRITFTSQGLAGLWAAVAAGLGLTLRTAHGLPGTLRPLDPGETGLPPLPALSLRLRRSGRGGPAVERLAALLHETLQEAFHEAFAGAARP